MTPVVRATLLAVLLAALAGAVGGWAGIQYGLKPAGHAQGLDAVLHHQLELSPDQENRIHVVEAEFAAARKTLEAEMHRANRDLATALQNEHTYGPAAQQAIEKIHQAMGKLQEQTVIHILAMRAELTPQQAERFDRTVREVLTSDHP